MAIRLLSVVFSKGFGWIDDQFLVIEVAQSWVDGVDYYHWLPDDNNNNLPRGFSFFYTGLHYLFFSLTEWSGLTNPQAKMFLVRLLHAVWSLLIIIYGYRITIHYGGKQSAIRVGWLLSLFWIFPFLSVRNLVEYASVPFLIIATWLVIRNENRYRFVTWLWIGLLFGLAFNIRYQTLLFTGGIGLVLIYRLKIKEAFTLGLGALLVIVLFQGGIDYLVWDKPFAQLIAYVSYNMTHAQEYITGPWYHYLLFLAVALIPPVSFFLLVGSARAYKMLYLFVPTLLFLAFHSYYPNKQERFISTILPFVMIMGVIGWRMIETGMLNPRFIQKWIRGSWILFWVINFILLIPVSTMYSKKARVESMRYLSQYPSLTGFLIEDSNKNVLRFPPLFYLEKWLPYQTFMERDDFVQFSRKEKRKAITDGPGMVLFFQPDHLDERVKRMQEVYPELVYETTIEPGAIDRLIHWLNPINDNQNIYIYRNKAVIK